jgi:hypothetical protein
MFDRLKSYWWVLTVVVAVGIGVTRFLMVEVSAAETKEKVDKLEEAVLSIERNTEQTALAFKTIKGEEFALWSYLILHKVDSVRATDWVQINVGPVLDSMGSPLRGIRYLDSSAYPVVGIMKTWKPNGPKVMDTLWDFRENE